MVATATGVVVCQLHFTGLPTLLVSCDSTLLVTKILISNDNRVVRPQKTVAYIIIRGCGPPVYPIDRLTSTHTQKCGARSAARVSDQGSGGPGLANNTRQSTSNKKSSGKCSLW